MTTTILEGSVSQVLGGGGDGFEGGGDKSDGGSGGDDEDGFGDGEGEEEAEDNSWYEGGGNKGGGGGRRIEGVERDKRGEIVKVCGIGGCLYKTLHTKDMRAHQARKHDIDEYVRKIPDDGKEKGK